MNLIMIYLSHFYGSNLWNLFDIDNIFIAWNKVVRIVNNLPYRAHRYLLEPFSGFTHVFTFLTNDSTVKPLTDVFATFLV